MHGLLGFGADGLMTDRPNFSARYFAPVAPGWTA